MDGARRSSIHALLESLELDELTVDYVEGLSARDFKYLEHQWRLIDSRPVISAWRNAPADERPRYGDRASASEMMTGQLRD